MSNHILYHEIHYKSNTAQWVVFLHGAGGSTATWKYQLNDFVPFYNVLLIDLRDHGKSKNISPSHKKYKFDIVTEDIMQVLIVNKVAKAHFITLSFGSVLLQDLSIKYPHLVASAIFAGGIFKANHWIKSFVNLARGLNMILPFKWMYTLFSWLLMPKDSHKNSRKIYQKQADKLTSVEYMKWVGLYAEFFQLLNRFFHQKIQFPGMVIMGREDYVFLNAANAFVDKQSKILLEVIDHAGHICNIDQPDIFNRLALNFINKNSYLTADLPAIQAQ
jgi:pimeloyl-ACP methyl ester carboxylesterase